MRKTVRRILVAVFMLLLPHAADAAQHFWGSNGAGCVPGDPAIQFDRYFITAGSVNYRPGGSGLVTLYCPVNPGPIVHSSGRTTYTLPFCPSSSYVLRMTYRDSDGTGAEVDVASQLIGLSKANGSLGFVTSALQSSSSGETGQTNLTLPFIHDLNFRDFYYYVRVDLNRASGSSAIATFYGVALECP